MNILHEDFAVLIDAGHGGISPITKKYTTAPAKMFTHQIGEYHGGKEIYEGVLNRLVAEKVEYIFQRMHIPFFKLYHDHEDTPLDKRVKLANDIFREYPKALGMSIHFNASTKHNATGLEGYTTPTKTPADRFAQILYENYYDFLDESFKIRTDPTDGDHDKEAKFYMLMHTKAPFFLSENGFFDNPRDAKKIMHPRTQWTLALCHVNATIQYAKELKYIR